MPETVAADLLGFIVERIEVGIFAVDRNYRVVLWNRFMATRSQRSAADVVGRNLFESFPELPRKWLERKIDSVFVLKNYAFTSWEQRPFLFRFHHNRPITGGVDAMRQNCTFLPQKSSSGEVELVCVTVADFTDTAIFQERLNESICELEIEKHAQRVLIEKLEDAQNQLMQSEKLAAIGQLAAGVAHEINNPIGFVTSNFGTLKTYTGQLLAIVDAYEGGTASSIDQARHHADLAFLREDLPMLIKESQEGLGRVTKIVQDLKDYSRVNDAGRQLADLNAGMESTLNVVWNELKYKAEVIRELSDIPRVDCIPAQINQVFTNLLINAAQAIPERGKIFVRSWLDGDTVCVEIEDTGSGMAEDVRRRIFEPFYTTKPVGKGTGLGLSISYDIVVKKHGGRLEVTSEPGKGSCFRVCLPKNFKGSIDPDVPSDL